MRIASAIDISELRNEERTCASASERQGERILHRDISRTLDALSLGPILGPAGDDSAIRNNLLAAMLRTLLR